MRDINDIVAEGRRDYILAEFRCAIVQAKLYDSDAVGFVGIELGGRA